MNSASENFEVKDLYELILDVTASNSYFVSEIFWDRVVINEVKLNMLTPLLLQELFTYSWNKVHVDENMCMDFMEYLLRRAYSVQKIFHHLEHSKYHRECQLTMNEKIVWIDFDIWWPDRRSPLLNKVIAKIGSTEMIKDYRDRYFKILTPHQTKYA